MITLGQILHKEENLEDFLLFYETLEDDIIRSVKEWLQQKRKDYEEKPFGIKAIQLRTLYTIDELLDDLEND